ncbi:MAG: YceD family protein [Pseudomonadota bacterium]
MASVEIDAFEFSRLGESRSGQMVVATSPRLVKECADASGNLNWTVSGGAHSSGYPELRMTVAGEVQLICQRCLKAFEHVIDSSATLVLARSDLQADQIEAAFDDALLDDESLDVIVVVPAMDLVELVEDEVLLSIPQAPKHEQCPSDKTVVGKKADLELIAEKPSPFAALKNLRH